MTIAFGSAGAKVTSGTTTITLAQPATVDAEDLLLTYRAIWMSGSTAGGVAGWTNQVDATGGINAVSDDHSSRISVYSKEAVGNEDGVSINWSQGNSPNGVCGVTVRYTKAAGTTWDIATSSGTDNTHGTNRSITTSSSISLQPGDMVLAAVAIDTDTNPTASHSFSASGITFGTVTARGNTVGSATGNDGNVVYCDALVTAGSGTVTITHTMSTSVSQCGPVAILRLREVGGGTTFTFDPIDNMGLTDTFTPELSRTTSPADIINLTDTFTKEIGKTFFDPLNLTDAFTVAQDKMFLDSIGISDLLILEKGRFEVWSDTLNLTDNFSKDYGKGFFDTLGLTDSVTLDRVKLIEDVMGLTDSISFFKGTAQVWSDTVGITDSITWTFGKAFTDSMQITDSFTKAQSILFIDNMGLTDDAFFIQPLLFTVTDSIGMTDSITWEQFVQHIKEPTVSLVDDKRELAIAFLVANAALVELDLRLLSIHDLAHKYWSFKAGQLDNQARSILDHMETFDPTKDPWDWLTAIE